MPAGRTVQLSVSSSSAFSFLSRRSRYRFHRVILLPRDSFSVAPTLHNRLNSSQKVCRTHWQGRRGGSQAKASLTDLHDGAAVVAKSPADRSWLSEKMMHKVLASRKS